MGVSTDLVAFEHTYAQDVPGLALPWTAAPVAEPELLVLNEELAAELGLDADALRAPAGRALLVGDGVPDTVAMAYSGHQFGNYSPRLGDGRALLLGELVDVDGRRRDLHLKGSGATPFSRGGDGFAAVGPMLREYVIGEAMHALGIPTTRALAVVATGRTVRRETLLPGAVLARVAASHLRVGTFSYAAAAGDLDQLRALADHAIARHHPDAAGEADPYLGLFRRVVDAQAELVARWMLVGFVHGVMNTDNMTISGETIDYGPCAFMDAFDPRTVFSSIDTGGRYAYGNQPAVAQWDLARLAEALLPLMDGEPDAAIDAATAVLDGFVATYRGHWLAGMAAKLVPPRPASAPSTSSWSPTCSPCCRPSASTGRRSSGRWPPAPPATWSSTATPWTPGRPGGRRWARTGPRWTASTRRTSRATTGWRRRWPPRRPAISTRSCGCSTSSAGRSTSGPGWRATRSRAPARSSPTAAPEQVAP